MTTRIVGLDSRIVGLATKMLSLHSNRVGLATRMQTRSVAKGKTPGKKLNPKKNKPPSIHGRLVSGLCL